MSKLTLNERTVDETAPATGKMSVYGRSDSRPYCVNAAGTIFELANPDRASSLGTAPSRVVFKVKSGPPDELYISMQKTGATWDWGFVLRMP